MAYRRQTTAESILDVFSLNPLPYPVLLILAVLLIFLGTSWYFSYEDAIETAQDQFGWALLATPIVLVLVVRWLSSMGEAGNFLAGGSSPWERQRRRRMYGGWSGDGAASPWGVAVLIVVLLVLLQFQSSFLGSWFIFN